MRQDHLQKGTSVGVWYYLEVTAICLWGIALPSITLVYVGVSAWVIHTEKRPVEKEKATRTNAVRIACSVCGSHHFQSVDNPGRDYA
jgi:hypothetical protein